MTEYETVTSNDIKNSLKIGNQKETRNRETTYLTTLSSIAHGVLEINKDIPRAKLSDDEVRELDSKLYDYKSTIREYLRRAWIETDFDRQTMHRQGNVLWARQKSARDDLISKLNKAGKRIGKAHSFIKQNKRSSNLDSGTKFIEMLKSQIEIVGGYQYLVGINCYPITRYGGKNINNAENRVLNSRFKNFTTLGLPTVAEYKAIERKWSTEDWRGLTWSDICMDSGYEFSDNADKIQQLHNLTNIHHSVTKSGYVAYYRDLFDMKKGREIVTTFGKYLSRYRDFLGLDESQIKNMADNFLSLHAGFDDLKLQYINGRCANDENSILKQQERWERAYSSYCSSSKYGENVHSCMTDKKAVRIYANPKSYLRLAILTDEEGKIHARCIVRDDEHRGYIRLYPHATESKLGNYLKQKLSADGYNKKVNLNGIYLDADYLSDWDCYRAPYIDGQSCSELGDKWCYANFVKIDDREYLHIDSDYETDYYLENTNGRSYQDSDDEDEDEERSYCERCDESMPSDDSYWTDDTCYCYSCYSEYVRETIEPVLISKDVEGTLSDTIATGKVYHDDHIIDHGTTYKVVDSFADYHYVYVDSNLTKARFDLYMNVAGFVVPNFLNPEFYNLERPFNQRFDPYSVYNYVANEHQTKFSGLKYWSKHIDLLSTEFGYFPTIKTWAIFKDLRMRTIEDRKLRRPKIFAGKEYNAFCKLADVKDLHPHDFEQVDYPMYIKDELTIVEQKPIENRTTTLVSDRKVDYVHVNRIKTLPDGMTCQIDNPDFIYLP